MLTTTDRQILAWLKEQFDEGQELVNLGSVKRKTLAELVGTVYNLDATEYLKLFPDNSIKLILTDEPYGQANTRLNLKARSDITSDFDWGYVSELPPLFDELMVGSGEIRLPTHLYTPWVFEAARVLQEHGILINFGNSEFTGTMRDVCTYAGLHWRASGPWIKTNVAPHFRKNNFRSGHETFFVASKGTTKGHINFLEQQEMINWIIDTVCPKCNTTFPVRFSNKYNFPQWFEDAPWEISALNSNKAAGHPTEKPDWLLTKFIKIFSFKDDIVIDPFGGSGATVANAARLGRRWGTNDLTGEWYEFMKRRMESQVQSYIS